MKCAVRIFFKEIRIVGLENLPKNKPVIIAANHNNAFMDAIVVAVFIEPQIYFLTRSDVFNTPLKKWILEKMNLIPIYRMQEGAGNLHKNEETFENCYRILSENRSILIFSEGICIQEKRLQKLKKGTARIAFGAELFKDFSLDLQVVPLGINYNKPAQFRSNLLLNFAPAIEVRPYREQLESDSNKAFMSFTRDLEKAMAALIVDLQHKSIDPFYDALMEIYGDELREQLNWKVPESNYFKSLRVVGDFLNDWKMNNDLEFELLKEKTLNYSWKLKELGLKDSTIKRFSKISAMNFMIRIFAAVLLFPLHLFSLLFIYWPYCLAYFIAKKTCKHIEFVASVMLGTGTFLYLLLFIIGGFVMTTFFTGILYKVLSFGILPLMAFFSLKYYRFLRQVLNDLIAKMNLQQVEELVISRAELMKQFNHHILPKIKSRNI